MLIRIFRRFLGPYRGLIALVLATSLLGTMAALTLPALNGAIVDRGIAHGDIGFIWRTGAAMLGISLVQGACSIASAWFGAKAAMSFGRDLRGALFGHVLALSTRELDSFGTASLITRNTGDVQQLQMLVVMSCTMLVTAPITMIGGIIMAAREDSHLFWLVALAMPVLAGAIGVVIARLRPLFATMQGRIDAVGRTLREQLTGLRVVRAFVRETAERARFTSANRDLTDTATAVAVLMAWVAPIVMVVLNVFNIALLWAGAHRIAAGEMQIGSLIAFLSYMLQILTSVTVATFLLMMIPRSIVCAGRIGEVLETEPGIAPRADDILLQSGPATVEFDGVDYAYPGAEAPVLRGIAFSAKAGETLAIIGSTGAGKTTLVSLLPRLLDVTGGAVRIDGIDVRRAEQASLHARIGFVPQKAFLFAGTVASNLRYGSGDASDDDLWHALRVAQAEDFVRALPEGLDAPIAQGGSNLSGGQRQRLAIARALLGRPDIYIFDDAFSALDMATEARLRTALRAETGQALTILVSQRVATIVDADRILVIEDGAIIGDGTHGSLLGDCPTYGEIVDSQQQRSAA